MKKMLLIWLLAAGFASAGATAQNIALGERVPELKIQTWLDNRQPEPAPTTYIEFFHSTNPACKTSLERLKEITGKSGTKLRVIVVTKEDPAKIAPLLRPYLSERISVGLNAEKEFHGVRRQLPAVRRADRRQEPHPLDGQFPANQRKTDRTINTLTHHVVHQDRPLRKRVRRHASRHSPQRHARR